MNCRDRRSSSQKHAARPLLLPLLLFLAICGGCARQPPGTNASSGVRLRVTLDFRAPISQYYYYFVLINNANDLLGNAGPIPVFGPVSGQSYGNGFATSSSPGKGGFTDFVLFTTDANQFGGRARGGYGVYHVREATPGTDNGEANNRANFVATGAPVNYVPPAEGPPYGNELKFEIDLSQLITDAGGQPLTDQNQAVTLARAIHHLQINVVATDILATDSQTAINKHVDSLGDNRSGQGNYFTLDVTQAGVIPSGSNDTRVLNSLEPSDNDVQGSGNPNDFSPMDLTSWTIEVLR